MNYLGLDFGLKHIGIALATSSIVDPLTTLPKANSIQLIKELVERNNIDMVIIGQPGKALASNFNKYISSLKTMHIPITVVDETLSSYDARQSLLHTSQSRRRALEHSVSAALILQSFLDLHLDLPPQKL